MKILIVESKTKARTIAKFLKGFYIVATLGHLFDLPKKEFGIYLENGKLKAKYLPIKGKNKIIQRLKNLISKAKEIYVASDPDREGEMIAQEIKMLANKNNLKRIVFHEITKNAILNALKNPTKIRQNLVLAQKSRRFLDRIIGYSLSPLLWKSKIGESAGRVQSAALKLIVLREKEIENFKEKIFYRLIVNFGDFKAIYFENKNKFLFEDKNYLEKIKNDLDDIFLIEKIEKRKNEIKKPTPLDTALLERLSFLKFKIPSYLTMKIAQSLYERGLITYPRTDSFYLSTEFLKDVKNFLKDDYEKPLMKKSKFSQEAHEAIRPTSLKINQNLFKNNLEKLIYLLIYFSNLSACSKNALIEKTIVFLKNKNYKFLSQGEKLIFEGFLKYYPFKRKFIALPEIKEGQILKAKEIKIEKVKTKPPKRYTEESLIKKLKELGIGRPSTYSEIIKTLIKRNYVFKEKNFLKPTEAGKRVIEFLEKNFSKLMDLNFTAEMEKNLDEIALGKLDYEKYIIDFWKDLKNLLRSFN